MAVWVWRPTYFYCLEPSRLFDLVVDDRLVLVDALISGAGENHVLEEREKKTQEVNSRELTSRPTRHINKKVEDPAGMMKKKEKEKNGLYA